jgi:hypothetical protein
MGFQHIPRVGCSTGLEFQEVYVQVVVVFVRGLSGVRVVGSLSKGWIALDDDSCNARSGSGEVVVIDESKLRERRRAGRAYSQRHY